MPPILILILVLLTLLFIFGSEKKEQRTKNLKIVLFIIAGIVTFTILVRIIPPAIAVVSGFVIIAIPFFNKIIKLLSVFSAAKSFFAIKKVNKNNSKITIAEAYDILGLQKHASKEEINKNYKERMKRNHPDIGGSDYVAKTLTEARDLLLKNFK